ncbi:MAG: hypothetical protein V2J65_24910 [Desulfobacteraceae bacterium]|jgi:hypothetical protein|nr:hypothetical protein [Desulfobacteraceae bacterium]
MSSKKKRRKKRKSNSRVASTVHAKQKGAGNHAGHPIPEMGQTTPSDSADEIIKLISKGSARAAVIKAKLYHKHHGTDESEIILVDAYAARIREMIAKGYSLEAKTLLELIKERYNCPDLLLSELNGVIAIREGKLDELVRPLDDPGILPEKRTTIERIIKNELVDLNLLAQNAGTSKDNPLKIGAQAVAEAFTKVTAGFLEDAEIALPSISRRSPLAPWKMLIRALNCFYRQDDEKCRKYLEAVDSESVPGRIVPLMREMIAEKFKANHGENSLILLETVTGSRKKSRDALRRLDNTLTAKKSHKLFKAIRNALKICDQSDPGLVEKLKQHIAIRSWMLDFEVVDVNRALGGPSLKDAYFWRLYARAAEMKGNFLWACAMLAEFRKHALHEGWFSEKSEETSAIYLYMADLLNRLPTEDFEWLQSEFEAEFKGFGFYYSDQPPSIQEGARKDTAKPFDTYFLYPERLYQMAAAISPTDETFRQWLAWTETHTPHWKNCDEVALAWHAAFPDNTRPLLYLMKSAENRKALKKALGYLDTAEQIDNLNPDVRKARLRLLVAAAVRHLKQNKTHLAQKDITAIEDLPQSREGDRPALGVALKSVCAMIDKDESEWVRWRRELTKLLEYPLAAQVVLQGLSTNCGLSQRQINSLASDKDALEGNDLVNAMARGCQVADYMGIAAAIPRGYEKKLRDFFSNEDNLHDTAAIRIIAETALKNSNLELAYAAAGAGLLQTGVTVARFLLLRARSLPGWEIDRQDDCITAAIELARRERDLDLIDEAIELRRNGNGWPFGFSIFNPIIGKDKPSMDTEALNQVLQREKNAREYPSSMMDDFIDDFDDDDDESNCRYCDVKNCPDRTAPYLPDELHTEDGDDDDLDIDELPDFNTLLDDFLPDFPPELMRLIAKVFSKHGKNGTFPHREEVARKDPWLADQLLREMQKAESDGSLPDVDCNWFPGWRPVKPKRNWC